MTVAEKIFSYYFVTSHVFIPDVFHFIHIFDINAVLQKCLVIFLSAFLKNQNECLDAARM